MGCCSKLLKLVLTNTSVYYTNIKKKLRASNKFFLVGNLPYQYLLYFLGLRSCSPTAHTVLRGKFGLRSEIDTDVPYTSVTYFTPSKPVISLFVLVKNKWEVELIISSLLSKYKTFIIIKTKC